MVADFDFVSCAVKRGAQGRVGYTPYASGVLAVSEGVAGGDSGVEGMLIMSKSKEDKAKAGVMSIVHRDKMIFSHILSAQSTIYRTWKITGPHPVESH